MNHRLRPSVYLKKHEFKEKLSCTGCPFDPTYEESRNGIVCKSQDQNCKGKAPKEIAPKNSDQCSKPINYSIVR